MTLKLYDTTGYDIYVDENTQEPFATVRGAARIIGVDDKSVRKFLGSEGADLKLRKMAGIPTAGGVQGADLIPSDVLADMIGYFAWRARRKSKQAQELDTKLRQAGAKLFLLGMAGYTLMLKSREDVELEKLKLQNQLAHTQERLLVAAHALDAVTPGLATAILCPADAVVERIHYVERVTNGDRTDEGVGITYIQRKYGFTSTKAAWAFLDSIGMGKESEFWEPQLSAVTHHKLPPEHLRKIDKAMGSRLGTRQIFFGE